MPQCKEEVAAPAPDRAAWPRPMMLHLSMAIASSGADAGTRWQNAFTTALNSARSGDAAAGGCAAADLASLGLGLTTDGLGRLRDLIEAIGKYQRHPFRRAAVEAVPIWSEGTTRLLDYGPPGGAPVLFVPSLVNRYWILDLMPGHSLMHHLRGPLRPILVDWGDPGPRERGFDVGHYVRRIARAIAAIAALAGRPVPVAGYCMGGTLAVAATTLARRDVAALALLAAPWDFRAGGGMLAQTFGGDGGAAQRSAWAGHIAGWGELPVDVLQGFFALIDPNLAERKFRRFAGLDPAGEEAALFVALEDWLNDGVPLVAGVARAALFDWYGAGLPAAGEWRVGRRRILPERLGLPTFAAVPRRDRLVPPASAEGLIERLGPVEAVRPDTGHIGLMIGSAAIDVVWDPLARWLARHAAV